MAIVQGNNVSLYIWDVDAYKLYACATDCSITLSTDTIETSVTGSGEWVSIMPQKHSWSGVANGVTNLDFDNNLTLGDLRTKQMAMTQIIIRFEYIDDDGTVYTETGNAYITRSTSTGEVNNVSTFSIEFEGTGALTLDGGTGGNGTTTNSAYIFRYEYTATLGETTITDTALIDRRILVVSKDGVSFGPIITSGTPINKEVLYDSATGVLTFPIAMEDDEELFILYQINNNFTMYRLDYTGIGGELFFIDTSLIGVSIVGTNRDGINGGNIITSGTPTGKQVKYYITTGKIEFAIAVDAGEEIFVLYQL